MKTSTLDAANLKILSGLLLEDPAQAHVQLLTLSRQQFDAMVSLANSHHVVVRSLEAFREVMDAAGDQDRQDWASDAIDHERARIVRAISFLAAISPALERSGCPVVVIKSLDHWPDLGSDLDLYTSAEPAHVIRVMTSLHARMDARSWGDRLANKWNFIVPGLPELVEIHMGRLGQTGELDNFARTLPLRARRISVGPATFPVPSPVDRLMICTLQRMYRHFYIRLCDIVDTVRLLETEDIDYDDLQRSARASGIWEGVATFLTIVSDYHASVSGDGIDLPESVRAAARFGRDQIAFAKGFLRVPILPHSVRLYASEWANLMLRGQVRSTARLSLLPWLATAAAVGMKITGSDKGIW